jgi:putative membrane protein
MTKQLMVVGGMLILAVGCSKKAEDLGGKSSPSISTEDNKFLTAVTESNLTEIRSGQDATTMSQNAEIKKFGKTLSEDHDKAGKEVKAVADKVGFTAPTELDESHKSTVESLAKKTGTDFDKAFLEDQIKGHKDAIDAANDEISKGSNADVKALATKLLPTLQGHLKMADELKTQMDMSTGATTMPHM